MSVSSLQTKRSNTIQLRFKTVEKHGILLTMGKRNEFITLEISLGRVRLEANLGGGNSLILFYFWANFPHKYTFNYVFPTLELVYADCYCSYQISEKIAGNSTTK